ncbi:polyamine ABC transporter substrate-binding protein [Oceanobacter mangrovi]|uniref:polyamine ABC transporter substrate-binding protein n=1 Tax=Oceanobacter mangrovi TaxID=2862510 RepID=UPI001FEA40DE|nr:polyamine ABC transporter substrate-binding protein [Oceanobacter mangrovi]
MTTSIFPQIKKLAATALMTAAVVAPVTHAEEAVLNFYNWSDYIGEETIANFEKEFGIKVNYDVYDSNEALEGKLLAGNTGFDLVVPTSNFMALQIKAGIFRQLDKKQLPNLKNLDPGLMSRLAKKDPGNQYGVPYLWGTTGLGYNPALVAEALGEDTPIDSWAVVFEPENMKKLAKCGVTFLDSSDEMYPFTMLYKGIDPNTKSVKEFKDDSLASNTLRAVRPYVKQFTSSGYISDLANGDICVAVGFSGDVFQAAANAEEADNGVEVSYVIPKEGSEVWFDMLMIPADAKHPEAAHKFINYLLRPDVIADITNYVWYANPTPASKDMVDEEITSDPAIYPTDDVMDKLFVSDEEDPKIARVRNRTWSDIKTGR